MSASNPEPPPSLDVVHTLLLFTLNSVAFAKFIIESVESSIAYKVTPAEPAKLIPSPGSFMES